MERNKLLVYLFLFFPALLPLSKDLKAQENKETGYILRLSGTFMDLPEKQMDVSSLLGGGVSPKDTKPWYSSSSRSPE